MDYKEEFEEDSFVGRGFLEDGKKEGTWHYFYDTGELKQLIDYVAGIQHGTYKFLSKNGVILIESTYVAGEVDGVWREYYEDGRLKEIGKYHNKEYFPIDFWDNDGNQLLKNGTGKKIEVYGSSTLEDVYEQYFTDGKFIKEIKINLRKV